jgi:hypothetical protein
MSTFLKTKKTQMISNNPKAKLIFQGGRRISVVDKEDNTLENNDNQSNNNTNIENTTNVNTNEESIEFDLDNEEDEQSFYRTFSKSLKEKPKNASNEKILNSNTTTMNSNVISTSVSNLSSKLSLSGILNTFQKKKKIV